jgi:hypothetical protein
LGAISATNAENTPAGEKVGLCRTGGIGGDPLVPTATAAREIYRAVVLAVVPGNLDKFPIIVVEDTGDHWSIGNTRHEDQVPRPAPPGAVLVTTGGGQFHMDLDKCSGTISNAALER